MSVAASQHCFEVIVGKPNKAEPEATREKMLAGIVLQKKHPDFVDIPLEGAKVEDDSMMLRIIEWTSYEGHMVNFRGSQIYKDFLKVREGSAAGPSYMSHYNFFGPLPLKPMAPVVEYLAFSIKKDMPFESFLNEFTKALRPVANFKGGLGFAVGRQVEDPNKVLTLIAWESVAAHLEEFPKSDDFEKFKMDMALVNQTYIAGGRKGMEMWHVKTCEPGMAV